jgi:hypothetical protein
MAFIYHARSGDGAPRAPGRLLMIGSLRFDGVEAFEIAAFRDLCQ